MKKLLLTTLALALTVGVYAQSSKENKNSLTQRSKAPNDTEVSTPKGPLKTNTTRKTVASHQTQTNAKSAAINVVPMGHAANAFGSISPRTQLDAVPALNTVGLIHRSTTSTQTPPGLGSGYFLYDLSTDGGATFTSNIGPIYDPTDTVPAAFANGRYPQGVIYNPPGNTNPMNAYWSWIGPTLTGENGGSWGSYAYGSQKLDGTGTVQRLATQTGSNGSYYEVAEDFTKAGTSGKSFLVQGAVDFNAADPAYSDTILVLEGTWNAGTGDYDYVERLIPFPATADVGVAYVSIAFNAAGTVGYLSALSHIDFATEADTVLTLITSKTMDGGATWGPQIQVDISAIADPLLLSDPNGSYSTGFEMKTAVDMNDNLHAVMAVGPDGAGTAINTGAGDWGIMSIFTTDGGTTWDGMLLGTPQQFRGTYDPTAISGSTLTEDSRPYITTTEDGEKVFYSWLDTDSTVFGTYDGNAHPDLWVVGYNVTTQLATAAVNFTTGTLADGEVSYGCAAKLCI